MSQSDRLDGVEWYQTFREVGWGLLKKAYALGLVRVRSSSSCRAENVCVSRDLK